jgi:ankyrin repeat protein
MAGADVNMADEKGLTPLYTAADRGDVEVVENLLMAGADLTRKNQ